MAENSKVTAQTPPASHFEPPDTLCIDDLFDIENLQRLQDQFSRATGVASIITLPDGQPITTPSNFSRFCSDFIRKSESGRCKCFQSDAIIGRSCIDGPTVQRCLSAGLWDAGAGISVGGHHLANWLIGQVRDENQTEEEIRIFAREIGADEEEMFTAFLEVPLMSRERFSDISLFLFSLTEQLSALAYQNVRQTLIIVERKQIEDHARQNEARLRSLLQALPDLVWMKDPDGVYLSCNKRFEQFFGASEREIVGKTDYDFMAPELAEFFRQNDHKAAAKGCARVNEEDVIFAVDGHQETLETIKTPIFTEDGRLAGVLGIGRDITERKHQEKLQAAKLRLLDFSTRHSNVELLRDVLDEAEQLTGSSLGFYHFVAEDQQTLSLQAWSTGTMKMMREEDESSEHLPITEAGVWIDCVRRKQPVIYNDYRDQRYTGRLPAHHPSITREAVVPVIRDRKIVAVIGVANKKTDYTKYDVDLVQQLGEISWEVISAKRAEDAQRESEARYRSMMDAMIEGAYISSADFHIVYMNAAMIKRTGRQSTGEYCYAALYEQSRQCPWCPMAQTQQGKTTELEIINPFDNRHYHISNTPIQHRDGSISQMTICRDITHIKLTEERLLQVQKMEAIGNLAGGIAHDFNNILTPILGLAEMMISDSPPGSSIQQSAIEIHHSAERAAALVKQILSFSKQSEKKQVPVYIHKILKEVCKLLRATIPTNIDLHQKIVGEYRPVLADPTQIHQILMNLITNAYHAVEDSGGTITIEVDEKHLDSFTRDPLLSPGRYVRLSVSDNGPGIPPEIQDKIFDPYFTTKKYGKGTGLGLSVVYGLVKDYGGEIQVISEPGRGTTFDIFLPTIDTIQIMETKETRRSHLPRGTERILLVDDEDLVLNLEKKMLERLGYHVDSYTDSLESLAAFHADSDAFDLLITDMSMPNLTGDQLAIDIMKIRPDLPIIICTGYSNRIDEQRAQKLGIKGFLMKPVVRSDLATLVRRVLDSSLSREGQHPS